MKAFSLRRVNRILSLVMIFLLLSHVIKGAFQLFGFVSGGGIGWKILSYLLLLCLAGHTVIGTILTIDSLRISKAAGKSYPQENRLFWIRRMSGFAMLFFAAFHVILMSGKQEPFYRLNYFGKLQLAASIGLVLALFVHLLSNIRPFLISLGSVTLRKFFVDILLILSVVLFVAAAGFIVYYFRWNVFWR